MPPVRRSGAQQRGVKGTGRARILGVAAQRQHEGVAVDDAGRGREQRGVAIQRRLQRPRLGAGKRLQVVDAIGLGMRPDRLQLLGFLRRGRDDQLAAIAVRDAVIPAIPIEGALAADAHPRHQAARLVVDAGVDHLAVARGCHGADAFGRLQNDHLAAGLRQPPRDRKADHPRTDDDALNLVHSRLESGLPCGRPRRTPLLASIRGRCRRIIALLGMISFEQPVVFVSERFPNRVPVSEALIMSGQLP